MIVSPFPFRSENEDCRTRRFSGPGLLFVSAQRSGFDQAREVLSNRASDVVTLESPVLPTV
jgi:hypothetical protein